MRLRDRLRDLRREGKPRVYVEGFEHGFRGGKTLWSSTWTDADEALYREGHKAGRAAREAS